MTHVRTQVREAVINVLGAEFGATHVGDIGKLLFRFQKRNLPFVAVEVSDSVSKSDKEPAGRSVQQRDFSILIRACVEEEDVDALAALDALSVRIEKALVKPSVLGVGRIGNWQCAGTTSAGPQPVDDGLLLAATTNFSGFMLTLDSDPERNLNS